jgi:quercetin dioxygenase-like cupin family protein
MAYFYQLDSMEARAFSHNVTSSRGVQVQGQAMFVGLANKPRGSGSRPHTHPVEQFNFVLKGTLKATVGDEEALVGVGGLIHIPANTVHTIVATSEEDAVFLFVKDKSVDYKIIPTDGNENAGPRYEPGFGASQRE